MGRFRRKVPCFFPQLLLVLFCSLLPCGPTKAWAAFQELNADNERIVQVQLNDGTIVVESIVAYEVPGSWVLPLGELSAGLGFAIQVSAALGKAEGFIIDESRPFRLDLNACVVERDRKISEFKVDGQCLGAVPLGDEIYVDGRLLVAWFPIAITVDPFKSQVLITPREKLPVQLKKDREREAARIKAARELFNPGYPVLPGQRAILEGPFLDQQFSTSRIGSKGSAGSQTFQSDSLFAGEVLGLEGQAYLSATHKGMNRWRATLARRDPDGNIFGLAGATEVEVFDTKFPSTPLIGRYGQGRGIYISNYPLNVSTEFGFQDFQGDILPGWEVEIYQNSVLLDRQVADDTGRYKFNKVPLYYGANQFKLVFYGPQGQRREEYKTFKIDSSTIRAGSRNYKLALSAKDPHPRYSLQLEQNFLHYFTASVGYSQLTLPNESAPKRFTSAGLNAYSDSLLVSAAAAIAQTGGKAAQLRTQLPFHRLTLGAEFTRLLDFRSEIFNAQLGEVQKDEAQADATFVLPTTPSVATTWRINRKGFVGDYFQTALSNRISTNIGPIYWNNELSLARYSYSDSKTLEGKLDASYVFSANRLRMGLGYNASSAYLLELESQNKFSGYTATSTLRHYLTAPLTMASINFSRLFSGLNLGASVMADTTGMYSVIGMLTFSLARDPYSASWRAEAESQASQGAASILAFLDRNRNGWMDRDEKPIEGMEILLNQRSTKIITDKYGGAFITRLPAYAPVDLTVGLGSIEDPMLRPAQRGVRFYPRPGKVTEVLIPVVIVGEADGTVEIKSGGNPSTRGGIEIELVDLKGTVVKITKTDQDGVYFLNEIPPGTYDITPSFTQLHDLQLQANPPKRRIKIEKDGSIESGVNFILER
ncbi:MAG TPA: hypothetical protein VJB59_03145 [Bdellovibrionota bacterium]|nr:hypothetical protein [Bdellovibrionota bacterium]